MSSSTGKWKSRGLVRWLRVYKTSGRGDASAHIMWPTPEAI